MSSADSARSARDRQSERQRRGGGAGLVAFLTHEHGCQAVRDALSGDAVVRFAERAEELRRSIAENPPEAALVELVASEGDPTERALEIVKRLTPAVPVCAYIPLSPNEVREAVLLAGRGLVADVITIGEDLRARLKELLLRSHERSETAAVIDVWYDRVRPEAYQIVQACIEASGTAVTVTEVARRLNKSLRALERKAARAGLPPVRRVVKWCRLLRAMYRLDRRGASVKTVASELGYPSASSLAQQLQRYTGLTMSSLRAGGGFPALMAIVRTELVIAQDQARRHRHGAMRGR